MKWPTEWQSELLLANFVSANRSCDLPCGRDKRDTRLSIQADKRDRPKEEERDKREKGGLH